MKRTEEQYNEYITIIIEKSFGRANITLKLPEGNAYYYAEKHESKWELKFCENGFYYDATLVETCKTLKACIAIIHDVCADLTVYYKSEEAEQEEPEAIEETDSFVVPVEDEKFLATLDKMHEIAAGPLIDLNDVISQLKSSLSSQYGVQAVKQVIDAKNDMKRTELTGYHVSGVITEAGKMMLSCDIYAQDLDIQESYLAYNVGVGYALYDEISLTRSGIYADSDAVKQFFVSRVKALEAETIKKLY